MDIKQSSASLPLPATPEEYRSWWEATTDIPFGYCWCGCGDRTNPATGQSPGRAMFRGSPNRYLKGHGVRVRCRHIEENRGYKTPCWVWQLKIAHNGYGHVTVGGRDRLAHRYMYEQHVGPIPTGLSLDHLCRVRHCVRPDHLEAVPMYVNQRRGSKTVLSVELVDAIKKAHAKGVEFPVLETLTGIKGRTIRAAAYGENWSKGT